MLHPNPSLMPEEPLVNIGGELHLTRTKNEESHRLCKAETVICRRTQKHFLWTIVGPDSSYSPFEIHICWKVLKEDKMEPPIHTEYFLSGGATTLIFIVDGAKAVNSLVMRSPIPRNIVVPPDSTMFAYRSFRMSTSHFMMDWKVVSWMPLASFPIMLGWNSTSGQRNRSLPTVMMFPSGSSYVFSLSGLSAASFISLSKSSPMYASFSLTSTI